MHGLPRANELQLLIPIALLLLGTACGSMSGWRDAAPVDEASSSSTGEQAESDAAPHETPVEAPPADDASPIDTAPFGGAGPGAHDTGAGDEAANEAASAPPPGSPPPEDLDGSVACDITIEIHALAWASELSWSLFSAQDVEILGAGFGHYSSYTHIEHTQQLPSGVYTLELRDAAGDGWNGSTLEIRSAQGARLFDEGLSQGASETHVIYWTCP